MIFHQKMLVLAFTKKMFKNLKKQMTYCPSYQFKLSCRAFYRAKINKTLDKSRQGVKNESSEVTKVHFEFNILTNVLTLHGI